MDVISDEARRVRLAQRDRLLPRLRTDDDVRIADDVMALHSTDPVRVVLSAGPGVAAASSAPGRRTSRVTSAPTTSSRSPPYAAVDDRVTDLKAMVGDTRFAVRFPAGVGRHLLFAAR